MSKKSERLLDALGELPDDKLEDAADFHPRRSWTRTLAHAAVLTLAVGLTGTWFLSTRGCGASGGGSDSPEGPYIVYAGPSFPLTLAAEAPDITADRQLTLDFLPTTKQWRTMKADNAVPQETLDDLQSIYDHWDKGDGSHPHGTVSDLLLIDRYVLTNHSDTDRTVTTLYPVPSSLTGSCYEKPLIWVDGTEAESCLRMGSYSGPAYANSPWSGERTAVSYPESWEGWAMQLENGANLARTLAPFEEPEHIPVTVYRFTNPTGPGESEEVPNPSIRASFRLDYNKTCILPMGFQSGRSDSEGGTMTLGFSIPQEQEPWEEVRFLVLGEPIENLTTGGFVTGGSDPDTPALEGCAVTLESFDSDLYTELYAMLERQAQLPWMGTLPGPELSAPLLWRELRPVLDQPMGLWNTQWADLDMVFRDQPRIIWQETPVTIPAGGSVTLTAVTRREGSFSPGGGDHALQHYDILPTIGSNLNFSGQTALLVDRDVAELVDQNFGFDPDNGINKVTLDLEVPRCYLSVYLND